MIQGEFANGLKYAIVRNKSGVGYSALSIKCGTRDEGAYNSGIAHFVEHSIFKGTKKKSAGKINGYLDKLGGEINAYTTKEEIVIHATVLKEDISKAIDLLFELSFLPTFPSKEIQTEKGVILDEINSYKDSPSEEIYDIFEEKLFDGHPLSKPILGTKKSVKKINSTQLSDFVDEHFLPHNMALSIVVDIDEKIMKRRIEKLLEKYTPTFVQTDTETLTRESEKKNEPNFQNLPFEKVINKKNYQSHCILGATAPSLYEEDQRIATVLLCNILGGPASNSILNSKLREKNGWVYNVECSYTQYSDTGIVVICLGCDKENLDKCLTAIHNELLKLQSTPLSPRRIKAAKKQLLGQIAISSDNGESQCLSMGKSLLAYGRVMKDKEIVEKIEKITAEEVMEVAKTIFEKERISKIIFV